jgi:hypothetical protein
MLVTVGKIWCQDDAQGGKFALDKQYFTKQKEGLVMKVFYNLCF